MCVTFPPKISQHFPQMVPLLLLLLDCGAGRTFQVQPRSKASARSCHRFKRPSWQRRRSSPVNSSDSRRRIATWYICRTWCAFLSYICAVLDAQRRPVHDNLMSIAYIAIKLLGSTALNLCLFNLVAQVRLLCCVPLHAAPSRHLSPVSCHRHVSNQDMTKG